MEKSSDESEKEEEEKIKKRTESNTKMGAKKKRKLTNLAIENEIEPEAIVGRVLRSHKK